MSNGRWSWGDRIGGSLSTDRPEVLWSSEWSLQVPVPKPQCPAWFTCVVYLRGLVPATLLLAGGRECDNFGNLFVITE